jgi:hypothetical protein
MTLWAFIHAHDSIGVGILFTVASTGRFYKQIYTFLSPFRETFEKHLLMTQCNGAVYSDCFAVTITTSCHVCPNRFKPNFYWCSRSLHFSSRQFH